MFSDNIVVAISSVTEMAVQLSILVLYFSFIS